MKVKVLTILVLSVVIVAAVATPASAEVPEYFCGELEDFTLSPDMGPPGTMVLLSGEQAWGNDTASILWDGELLANITTGPAGIFSHSFTVPATATPGVHTVVFDGYDSEDQSVYCARNFMVTEATGQTLTPPPPGGGGATGTQQSTTATQSGTYSATTVTSLPSTGLPLPLPAAAAALAAGGLALTALGYRRR